MQHILRASARNVHWGYYDPKLEPVLKVRSGDTIEVYTVSGVPEIVDLLGIRNKIPKELDEIHRSVEKGPGGHILLGPIYIEGATSSDTLQIDLLEIAPWVHFGYNFFSPGIGCLAEDFPYVRAKYVPIDQERSLAVFSEELKIPLRPFFGNLGVAPVLRSGRITSQVPGPHGGNLDNRELTASSRLYLPIYNEGGLFSIGDGHALQGDGEVDSTALETCMRGKLKLTVKKGIKTRWPIAENREHFILMGFDTDLDEAFKMALRNTIQFLTNKGFGRDEAYMLCSLRIDFHVTQVVNEIKGIHALVSKDLLLEKSATEWTL